MYFVDVHILGSFNSLPVDLHVKCRPMAFFVAPPYGYDIFSIDLVLSQYVKSWPVGELIYVMQNWWSPVRAA